MNTSTLIIGAGISGLHTAYRLAQRGQSFFVLEARKRTGGRIHSPQGFDIGPSWFWPGQSHIQSLIEELGLSDQVVTQFAIGEGLYQRGDQSLMRGVGGFSMGGSYRLKGGLSVLIDTLMSEISKLASYQWLRLEHAVTKLEFDEPSQQFTVSAASQNFIAEQVVLALPPRVALATIDFKPVLQNERIKELNQIETWMAGHAKIIIEYAHPFWREQGLSGDVISELGPLREIHDASQDHLGRYALFGFFAVQAAQRQEYAHQLEQMCITQLSCLFGEKAARPSTIYYQDWSREAYTASEYDQQIQTHHPLNHWPIKTEALYSDKLFWSGSEAAKGQTNGYIEGALVASDACLQFLLASDDQ